MADFQALLDEQKRTTEAVAKNQGKSALDGRSGAGKALLDQQKRTNEVLQNIVNNQKAMQAMQVSLMPPKELEEPKEPKEEEPKKEEDEGGVQTKSPFERIAAKLAALQKSFEKPPWGHKIVDSLEKGYASLKKSISNLGDKFKTVGKGVLAAGAAIIGYELLIRFFKSDYWAELSTKIIPALKDGFEYVKNVFFDITNLLGIESVGGQIATAIALVIGGKLLMKLLGSLIAKAFLANSVILFKDLAAVMKSNKGILGKTTQSFKAVGKFLGNMGKFFGKLFLPIGIIISLFDGVRDAVKVFEETGSYFEAIKEGLASTIANFVGFPLNFIKSVIGFVAGLFGFDNVKEKLAEFDFVDIIKGGIHAVFDFYERLGKTIKAFVLAAKDGILALAPGGKSPEEAFSERFAKEMGKSSDNSDNLSGTSPADKEKSGGSTTADERNVAISKIYGQGGGSTTEEQRNLAIQQVYGKEKDRNLNQASSDNKGGNNSINIVNQNSTTNNSNSQVNYAKNLKSGQYLDQLASLPI